MWPCNPFRTAQFIMLATCFAGSASSTFAEEPAGIEFKTFSASPADHERRAERGFRALYVMDRDGNNVQYLVAGPGQISSATPEWSHNGHYIAFDGTSEFQDFSQSHIFVYAVMGPMRGVIRDLGHGNVPSWSPDDTRLAFMLNPGNPRGDRGGIWTMNADGSDRQYQCEGWYPRWSPDGKLLAVQCVSKRPSCVQILDLETGQLRDILGQDMEISYSGATWTPKGDRLLFVGRNSDGQHIGTVSISGDADTLETLYTEHRPGFTLVGPPAMSSDGKQIVFAIQEPNDEQEANTMWFNTHLYKLSLDGPPTALEDPRQGTVNRGMWFSPDGQTIVFSSER